MLTVQQTEYSCCQIAKRISEDSGEMFRNSHKVLFLKKVVLSSVTHCNSTAFTVYLYVEKFLACAPRTT